MKELREPQFPTKFEKRVDIFWNTSEWFWTITAAGPIIFGIVFAGYKLFN